MIARFAEANATDLHIADAEFTRNLNFNERLRFVLPKQHQRAGIGGAGEYREIHPVRDDGGAKGKRPASPEADAPRSSGGWF